jgi:riboflavin synthase
VVDSVGEVVLARPEGGSWKVAIRARAEMAPFIAEKGSITVNGVSLTVNRVNDLPALEDGCEISINLIPHTVENTALGQLQSGSQVNLEIDLIARYVERMLQDTPKAFA